MILGFILWVICMRVGILGIFIVSELGFFKKSIFVFGWMSLWIFLLIIGL